MARVQFSGELPELADPDGAITFAGKDWLWVVGAAFCFVRHHIGGELPAPFGYRDRGTYYWWDGAITKTSRLDTPEIIEYVRDYFAALFPGREIFLEDRSKTKAAQSST